jgi:hypothetical protein
MDAEEYKKRLTDLQFIITHGLGYFKAWAKIYNRDEETARALNRYKGLIILTQYSFRDIAHLQFAKVFDTDPRTSSLRVLLKEAKENPDELTPNATSEELADLESQIDSNEDLLERLKTFRDQYLAHHDAHPDENRLNFGEMNQLADDIQSWFNSLSSWHDQNITIFDHYYQEAEKHTSDLVQLVREERKRVLEQRQRLLRKKKCPRFLRGFNFIYRLLRRRAH